MISKVKKIFSLIQNNFLKFIYILKPKYFHYQSYNLFRNYAARPKIVGLELTKDTLIGKKKDLIYLPNDTQLTWQVMKYGELDYKISKIIKTNLKNAGAIIRSKIFKNISKTILQGTNYAFRKKFYNSIGGYDENFTKSMGGGDVDFWYRIYNNVKNKKIPVSFLSNAKQIVNLIKIQIIFIR